MNTVHERERERLLEEITEALQRLSNREIQSLIGVIAGHIESRSATPPVWPILSNRKPKLRITHA